MNEYSGKTEKEAIEKAIEDLGVTEGEFDVEILPSEKTKSMFRRAPVRIRVYPTGGDGSGEREESAFEDQEIVARVVSFLTGLLEHAGRPVDIEPLSGHSRKLRISLNSSRSAFLIGRKGKTLDALQLLANAYVGKISGNTETTPRVILDIGNYREKRRESLERVARRVAEEVKRTESSKLMEPMNPFERRLVHTALSEDEEVTTQSEGKSPFRQVRVSYVGPNFEGN